jgi:hypothetical protein
MKRALLFLPVFACALLTRADEQKLILPRDGTFYVEAKPVLQFRATLTENWVCPNAGEGTLYVFAPMLPELAGQRKVSTRLLVKGNDKLKAEEVVEEGIGKRPMLRLRIDSNELSPKSGIHLRLEYRGTLYARTLKLGKSPKAVPELTEYERRQYLATSVTMDYNDPEFLHWINEQGLKQRRNEDTMQFAQRVFTYLIKNGKYSEDTFGSKAHRPSRVCKSLTTDCGGFSLLFVAVMRANNVPARTLFGRWAIPQTDERGQHHVIAEFLVEKSGWVPVDIAGTIVHKPNDLNAFFGNTNGKHIAFHIDTDLEPAKGFHYAKAQSLLLKWCGQGDFRKEHRCDSKWDVQLWPLTKH